MTRGSRYLQTPRTSSTSELFGRPLIARALGAELLSAPIVFPRPPELSARDWAVFLLHTAAEVEHALMVQYLFAAYSLRSPGSSPARTLVTVATEEMGHLLTVQNILRLLGAPLCFEREDFPVRSKLYPFPFHLERLTKNSVAKYLFTEMSEGEIPETQLPAHERAEIEERARKAVEEKGGTFINHVETLYRTLILTFRENLTERDIDASAENAEFQAAKWRGTNATIDNIKGVKLIPVKTLGEAISALEVISQQGEAARPDDMADSHFERFLGIYRTLPEDTSALTRPVARDPHTGEEGEREGAVIKNQRTKKWAQLFNVRYRMLLTSLMHYMTISEKARDEREMLKRWSFEEMRGSVDDGIGLNALALALSAMALGDAVNSTAGAPFELPYSLSIPDTAPGRWRLHRDLIDASSALIAALRQGGPDPDHDDILQALLARDGTSDSEGRRQVIKAALELRPV